jgi:nitrite reductase/ring-hydroxylating ferredoxin subunit
VTESRVPADPTRRAALGCAGALCVAALAGCTTYNSNSGSAPPPASTGSGSGGGGGGGGGGGNGGGGGAPALTTTSKVPVGGGEVLADQKIVVTQPKTGTFAAFTAVCTHQGCLVNEVSGGTINCPCHGSKFSITNGSVVNGPATSPLASVGIKVQGKNIVRT